MTDRWYVVVPVKPLPVAKSRLRADVPAWLHRQLVQAWCWTRSSGAGRPLVAATVVVTADAELAGGDAAGRVCPDRVGA